MMYRYIQKTLDWGVKVASLAVTGPATWVIASQLFADVTNPILFFIMRAAAVFLVEGVLLSNWVLLEFDKAATPEIKARYGVTALVMYIALLVIAWQHEGPVGLVFRLALLAALIGSGWDTYVYTWQRTVARVDRSAEASYKVRQHARNLSIKEAIMRREAEHIATTQFIKVESSASLEETNLYGQRRIAAIQLQDKSERLRLMAAEEDMDSGGNGKKKRLPAFSPVVTPPDLMMFDPSDGRSWESHILRRNIVDALGEDPKYTNQNLAQKLGTSEDEITSTVDELIEDGYLVNDGPKRFLSERAGGGNGKRVRSKPRR